MFDNLERGDSLNVVSLAQARERNADIEVTLRNQTSDVRSSIWQMPYRFVSHLMLAMNWLYLTMIRRWGSRGTLRIVIDALIGNIRAAAVIER